MKPIGVLKKLKGLLLLKDKFDWMIVLIPVIITVLGIMTIYSATRPIIGVEHPAFYIRQTIWLIIGIVSMAAVSLFDYRRLIKLSYFIYIFALILLLLTLVVGHAGMGAQRWLRIGPIGFQPSEFFRICLLIAIAGYLSRQVSPLRSIPFVVLIGMFGALPFLILYLQPDLGSAILILSIVIAVTLIKGINRKLLVTSVVVILVTAPFLGNVLWKEMKQYQKNRLVAFINPKVDPKGIGYQIEQSKVTIGSGRLLGKGYLKGTQGPLRFLPEKHTDFIFAVFAEEWGFFGSVILLALYALIILRGFETALYAKDDFGFLLATGISIMFLIYLSVNIGMAMGLMPVVGVPLPFFSYGGTALVANFIGIGLLNNIRMRRYELFY